MILLQLIAKLFDCRWGHVHMSYLTRASHGRRAASLLSVASETLLQAVSTCHQFWIDLRIDHNIVHEGIPRGHAHGIAAEGVDEAQRLVEGFQRDLTPTAPMDMPPPNALPSVLQSWEEINNDYASPPHGASPGGSPASRPRELRIRCPGYSRRLGNNPRS